MIPGQELPGTLFLRIFEHIGRRAVLQDPSVIHEDYLIGHISGKCHLMGHDDHGHMLLRQLLHDTEHFSRQLRVQRRSGFIESENVRLQSKGSRNSHTLALAAGKLVRVIFHPVAKSHLL